MPPPRNPYAFNPVPGVVRAIRDGSVSSAVGTAARTAGLYYASQHVGKYAAPIVVEAVDKTARAAASAASRAIDSAPSLVTIGKFRSGTRPGSAQGSGRLADYVDLRSTSSSTTMKGPRTKRPRTSYKKKSWKRSYRKAKTAFPLNIIPHEHSGRNAFVKVQNVWQSGLKVTPATQGASDLWQIGLNFTAATGYDPTPTAITQRPEGVAEFETMYKQYRVRFCKIKFNILPGGSGTNYHLLCQLHTVRGDTGAMTHGTGAGNWNAIINSSKSVGHPLLDIGNDYHDHKNGWGYKRVFFPHKVLGISKRTYITDMDYVANAADYPGGAYNSAKTAWLYVYVANNTAENSSVATASYALLLKQTFYLELIRPQNL